jgi:hypothetical protein
LALSVPLSRFTPRVGGGSAFYVRQQSVAGDFSVGFRGGVFCWFGFGSEAAGELVATGSSPESYWFELAAVGWLALKRKLAPVSSGEQDAADGFAVHRFY